MYRYEEVFSGTSDDFSSKQVKKSKLIVNIINVDLAL